MRATAETVVLLSQRKADDVIEVEIELDELDLTAAESKATYAEIKDYVLKEHGLKVSNLYISQVKRKCGIEVGENYNLRKATRRMDGKQLVIDCDKAEEQVVFDEPEDAGILARLARKEPASYVSIAMRPGGPQDYVDVWNELN